MTLHHVALATRRADVPAEVAFWALLGFVEVARPHALRERATWLQAGPTQIHLLYADDAVAMTQGHVAVVAPDFDATIAALEAAGHATEERARHWGAARSYVRSPAGHAVEVMAAPPAG